MSMIERPFDPDPPSTPPPLPRNSSRPRASGRRPTQRKPSGMGGILVVLAVLLLSSWFWYGWRIEPGPGEIAILMRKTGKDLPPDQILAPGPGYKGIQEEVLPEGRFFRNPYTWHWKYARAMDIPAGKFGVLVRKTGKNLPSGEIIARDDSYKGVVREVLGTGRHRINPYAYDLKIYDDITIKPGHVGVVTSLCGTDILSAPAERMSEVSPSDSPSVHLSNGQTDKQTDGQTDRPTDRQTDGSGEAGFLVSEGEKGVLPTILKEGTHRLNPFLYSIMIVNIQSQRFELSGADAITFLTLDGFTVSAEGTLEFNLDVDRIALLSHEVGDMDDILQKIILPAARGFSRIEGSKKSATEFIVGESRQAFQNSLETYLKSVCAPQGVSLNSVLIRDIFAPQEIAGIIRERELAVQDGKKFEQQIVQAQSQAELGRQKALAAQNSAKVAAETERIQQKIQAEQKRAEAVIAAQTQLEIAATELKAAEAEATARLTEAEAERKVVEARTTAEADVLRQEVEVYENEADYVRAKLYEKAAPHIESVVTGDSPGEILGLPVKAAVKGGAQ